MCGPSAVGGTEFSLLLRLCLPCFSPASSSFADLLGDQLILYDSPVDPSCLPVLRASTLFDSFESLLLSTLLDSFSSLTV